MTGRLSSGTISGFIQLARERPELAGAGNSFGIGLQPQKNMLQISRCSSFDTPRGRWITSHLSLMYSHELDFNRCNLMLLLVSSFNLCDGTTGRHVHVLSVVEEIWLQDAGWDEG